MPTALPATSFEAQLARLDAEIRASVAREDFSATGKLFEQYRAAVEQCVRTASHPQAMCRSLSGRVQDLFEWTRRMTLVSRAKYQNRLNAARDASQYLDAHNARVAEPMFRVKG
jgi:hypothetical protein